MLNMAGFSFADRLTLILAALTLVLPWGWMLGALQHRGMPNPDSPFEVLIRFLEKKLNRTHRSEKERRFRGLLLAVILVVSAAWAGNRLSAALAGQAWRFYLEVVLLALMVPVYHAFAQTRHILRLLQQGDVQKSRDLIFKTTGRSIAQLDEYGVTRAAIESLVEHFAHHIVSPLFWYLLLGLPGLFACKLITLSDRLIGHRTAQYKAFGWATAKLDDFIHLVPARLSGLLLACASAFVPGGHTVPAFRILWRDASKLISPNSGWPIAATAGALKITLGGPRSCQGIYIEEPWIGDGTVKVTVKDARRTLYLYGVSCGLIFFITALALSLMPQVSL